MIEKFLKIFGDSNEKQIARYRKIVDQINSLEPELSLLTDDQLSKKTFDFRQQVLSGSNLEDLLPQAFAVVREASIRVTGLRHYDEQLIGGIVLHEGKAAEMKTGEGKTLVATLPTYLNALTGLGVHVVTVNDYLAQRDALWMGSIYQFLGMSVSCLQHESSYIFGNSLDPSKLEQKTVTRKDAYLADITYGTNNEFGFDYLRDNMATDLDEKVQRELTFAIVDEVDNILIDEARTPLIISGPAQQSNADYVRVSQVIPRLQNGKDFYIEEKERQAILTESGIGQLERLLNINNLYDADNFVLTHFVENGLRAQFIFQRDKDYVVKDSEVVIVDEFTGRLMPGRRYGEGLHQAIEAKERVPIQRETITYATVTLQNYFRMYEKLSGMTGTAITEAEEFFKVYGLEVVEIPTHKEMIRKDLPDYVYKTHSGKIRAVVDQIKEVNDQGRPILVGTTSVERSEQLSQILRKNGIKHEVLNAKNHQREADIIREAGKLGAVTVSTNMAGRGTDIVLGGSATTYASLEEWQNAHDEIISKGGLYVLGTERHESRRIDNQLRGRSGRQGDPGETRFFGSLEDEILLRFSSGMMGRLVGKALPEDTPLESGMLSKTLEMTQGKAESYFFDLRKHLVEYDDVVNRQREIIYEERDKVLTGTDLKLNIQQMIGKEISGIIRDHLHGDPADWNPAPMLADLNTILPLEGIAEVDEVLLAGAAEIEDRILGSAEEFYEQRENEFGEGFMRIAERFVMLQVIDRLWVQHLTMMSNLRQGIGLYAYGQRDPLVMYKKEGHEAFDNLLEKIQHDVAHTIFHVVPGEHSQSSTVMTAVARRQDAPSKLPPPTDIDPNAPRWARRQAARAQGGSKKAKKRKAT